MSLRRNRLPLGTALGIAGALAATLPLRADPKPDELVASSEKTLEHFVQDPDLSWFRDHVHDAKAVLIAPKVVKAGFILGGSGGHGLLLYLDPDKDIWVGPAFYSLATASVGFQAGVEVSELVTLVMTEKGLNALLSSSFKIGGDASVAVGPVGAGAHTNVVADLITFARSKGLYGGLNLDGTVVKVAGDWNGDYYGRAASPTDILIRQKVTTHRADSLRKHLASASRP